MAQKISKNYKVSINGIVCVDNDDRITVCVEDRGEFSLADIMRDFNDKECKINITYDTDYVPDEDEDDDDVIRVDRETGEVI